jgi:ribosome-associated toxin RatA of RatAB toxin-antitoxin module
MVTRQSASIQVDAAPETVFSTLSDYNSYETWMPGVSYSYILAQEGDIIVAEFVWPIYVTTKFNLEFIHTPSALIVYVQTDQYGMRGLSGRWDIKPASDGRSSILSGEMCIKTRLLESFGLRRKLRSTLESCLAAVAERARARPQGAVSSRHRESRTKILEVMKNSDELRVWLFGEVYKLQPGGGQGASCSKK